MLPSSAAPIAGPNSTHYSVTLDKEDFKFNCAHFIAYKGFRERLHGHNYRVSVSLSGQSIGPCGYLIDFGEVKKAMRGICKSLNEYFICPMLSDALRIQDSGSNVCIECEDGAEFSFPRSDCLMLPLVHSSAEELSRYIFCLLVRKIGIESLANAGIRTIKISVAECKGQIASFESPCPVNEQDLDVLETSFRCQPQGCLDR